MNNEKIENVDIPKKIFEDCLILNKVLNPTNNKPILNPAINNLVSDLGIEGINSLEDANRQLQPQYMEMLDRVRTERKKISNDNDFIQQIIVVFLNPVIDLLISQYGNFMSDDKKGKILGLHEKSNIDIINIEEENVLECKADPSKGKIIIIKGRFSDEEKFLKSVVNVLSSIVHEAIHLLITLQSQDDEARMFYKLEDGRTVYFLPGKEGQILNEGLAEWFSFEFCGKNNIFCGFITPSYISFVLLCKQIQKLHPEVATPEFLFNADLLRIYGLLSQTDLNNYLTFERLAMLNHFSPYEYNPETKTKKSKEQVSASIKDVKESWTEDSVSHKLINARIM